MQRSFERQHALHRHGFTLIELIVVIMCGLLLLGLFLPATRQARESARRVQCMSNLKNLSLAVQNYASGNHGKLPLLAAPAPGLASGQNATWALALMPYLDRADTHEYITQAATPALASTAVHAVLSQSFSVLQCPNDVQHFKQPGGLSYGANIGYGPWRGMANGMTAWYSFGAKDHGARGFDWNANGKSDAADRKLARATGVFWFSDEDKFRLTLDDMHRGDGIGTTILFAESLNLTPMHKTGPAKNGLNPGALDAGIGLGIEALGLVPQSPPSLLLNRTAAANDQYTRCFKPGGTSDSSSGGWPRTGSLHSGTVNAAFVDGHVSSIDNNIDWTVWASLHSPFGQQHCQKPISEAIY